MREGGWRRNRKGKTLKEKINKHFLADEKKEREKYSISFDSDWSVCELSW